MRSSKEDSSVHKSKKKRKSIDEKEEAKNRVKKNLQAKAKNPVPIPKSDAPKKRNAIYMARILPRLAPHISCFTESNILGTMADFLHEDVIHWFLDKTIFGVLLLGKRCTVQPQMMRCVMTLETKDSSPSAIVLYVNGSTLKFTEREFCIISSLNVTSNRYQFKFDTTSPNRLLVNYFGGRNHVEKSVFFDSFKRKVWGENKEDEMKFAILFFIHAYILTGPKHTSMVTRLHFDLVETGQYEHYPWGSVAFEELSKSISSKLNDSKKFYGIHGMPLVLQVWLYECCSNVNAQIAKKDGKQIPRILNWETAEEPVRYDELMELMFKDGDNKVSFQNIQPTREELAALHLPPAYQAAPSDDDFQDLPPQPPHVSSSKGKAKIDLSTSPAKKKMKSSSPPHTDKKREKQPLRRTPHRAAKTPRPIEEEVKNGDTQDDKGKANPRTTRGMRHIDVRGPSIRNAPSNNEQEYIFKSEFVRFKKKVFKELDNISELLNRKFDVMLYYLRKKNKYNPCPTYKFSTVDCYFTSLLVQVHANIRDGIEVDSLEESIKDYISGYRLHATVPWHNVDHIFIPVHIPTRHHWVLAVVTFEERCIFVYDSYSSAGHNAVVHAAIEKIAAAIPLHLGSVGFYDEKGIVLSEHAKFKDKEISDPYDIDYVVGIPQQESGSLDCGVYMIAYAEFLSCGLTFDGNTQWDALLLRRRYAALLWDYASRKNEAGVESDSEAPMKPHREFRYWDHSSRIDIED